MGAVGGTYPMLEKAWGHRPHMPIVELFVQATLVARKSLICSDHAKPLSPTHTQYFRPQALKHLPPLSYVMLG